MRQRRTNLTVSASIYGILLIARYKPETFVRQLPHELSKIVLIPLQNGKRLLTYCCVLYELGYNLISNFSV